MKYTKTLTSALVAIVLVVASVASASDFKGPAVDTSTPFGFGKTNAENWTLSLGGGGATTTTGDFQSAFGLNFQLGHTDKIIIPGEVGLRQGIGWSSTPDKSGSDWLLSTAVYQDWKLLSYKSLDLYAGGNVALGYGNTTPRWSAGPEVEARLWLKKDVYTYLRTEYNFDLNTSEGIKGQDALRFFLGVGFTF